MHMFFSQDVVRLENDLETPVGLFLREMGDRQGILLESAEVDGRWGQYSIIASDFLLIAESVRGCLHLKAVDPTFRFLQERYANMDFIEGLRAVQEHLEIKPDEEVDLPPIVRSLYGYCGYGVAGMLEKKLSHAVPPEEAEACFVLPGTVILFDHLYNRIFKITLKHNGEPLMPVPESIQAKTVTIPPFPNAISERHKYIEAVQKVQKYIHQGEVEQVVVSAGFSAELSESPFLLYRRLRRLNPSPYMFYMRFNDSVLAGSSPEVLITCRKGELTLCPIAGTRPRGDTKEEDDRLAEDLLQDEKERTEHIMLVELGKKELTPIAKDGVVTLQRFMDVERFSHVMHLTSRLNAVVDPELDGLDVLQAAFPAGTVSGAPKIRAMELIAEMEQNPRGPYAGAVGWISLDKDTISMDFGIIIRSLWVRGGQVHWQAGAGIVADSVPEREWEECLAKTAIIRKVVLGDTKA